MQVSDPQAVEKNITEKEEKPNDSDNIPENESEEEFW